MRPIRINGHRVRCPYCKRKYANAPVFGTVCCSACLRALTVGVFTGRVLEYDDLASKYDLIPKGAKE